MRRRILGASVGGALLVAALAALLVRWGGSDDRARTWGAPEVIPSGRASAADTALTGDGTIIAVWSEERRGLAAVMSSERPPGGAWTAPRAIQEPKPWAVVSPSVAVNATGDAVVTFSLRGRREAVLLGAFRSAGRDWEPAQAIAPVTPFFFEAAQDISGGGGLAIAYSSPFSESPGVFVTTRGAGAPWADATRIGPARHSGIRPQLAIAGDGRAFLATLGAVDARGRPLGAPRVYERDRAGDWRGAPVIPGRRGGGELAIAVDAAGRPTVAWIRVEPGGRAALVASRLAAGAWSPPRVLDRAPGPAWFTPIDAAPSGAGITLAWARWERRWTRATVRAATSGADGAIGPAQELESFAVPDLRAQGPGATPGPPPTDVRLSRFGDPIALWSRLVSRQPERGSQLRVSARSSEGSWSVPTSVTPAPIRGWPLSVGRAGEDVVATWAELVGSGTAGVRIVAAEGPG